MKKPKHESGTFLRIPLPDGTFGYGRVLERPYVAFYNFRTTEPSADLRTIESKPVLFRQAVRLSTPNHWVSLGKKELVGEVAEPVVRFTQDVGDFRKCVIFDTAGNTRDATPEECVGLERAAVWESLHIEERLLDTFMGRPNLAGEHLRVRLK
jgi:hypothetical protein